ncbi:unnamed protein product, partial [Urochloa humidicola]
WPPARLPHLRCLFSSPNDGGQPLVLGNGDGEREPILPLAPWRHGGSRMAARLDLAGGGTAPALLDPATAIAPFTGGRQFHVV